MPKEKMGQNQLSNYHSPEQVERRKAFEERMHRESEDYIEKLSIAAAKIKDNTKKFYSQIEGAEKEKLLKWHRDLLDARLESTMSMNDGSKKIMTSEEQIVEAKARGIFEMLYKETVLAIKNDGELPKRIARGYKPEDMMSPLFDKEMLLNLEESSVGAKTESFSAYDEKLNSREFTWKRRGYPSRWTGGYYGYTEIKQIKDESRDLTSEDKEKVY